MLRLNQFPQLGKFNEIKKHISKWTSRVHRVMLLWPFRTRDIINVQLQSQSCEKAVQSNRSVQPCSYKCTTIKVYNPVPTSAVPASRAIYLGDYQKEISAGIPPGTRWNAKKRCVAWGMRTNQSFLQGLSQAEK